ncbi:MAG: hypothetical protein IT371_25255 [Deltaproteobacteria bacterium]|nr:hypothetical protein [Deltaproteobacteria bacterium]
MRRGVSCAVVALVVGLGLPSPVSGPWAKGGDRAAEGKAPVRSELPERREPPPSPELAEGAAPREEAPSRSLPRRVVDTILELKTYFVEQVTDEVKWIGGGILVLVVLLAIVRRALRSRRRTRRPGAGPSKAQVAAAVLEPLGVPQPSEDEKVPLPEPLVLTPAQELLCAAGVEGFSLYEVCLALGPEVEAVEDFRRVVEAHLAGDAWSTAVSDGRADTLSPLRGPWVRATALRRVERWLAAQPTIKKPGLQVQVPGQLERGELGTLTLTRADGLGVELTEEQEALLGQARDALALTLRAPDHPYQLAAVARELALAALLPAAREDRGPGATPLPLALLLGGLVAQRHAEGRGLSRLGAGTELCAALDEHHELVQTPVPAEGLATFALSQMDGVELPGMGALLAAMAGAAFSPSTVVLKLSKRAGEVSGEAAAALERLGVRAARALAHPGQGDGPALAEGLSQLVGEPLLAAELRGWATAARSLGKGALRVPLYRDLGAVEQPDAALVELHRAKLEHAARHAVAARRRVLLILHKLAYEGAHGEHRTAAARRLGYAVAGLGMTLLRSGSTELLSTGREALAALKSFRA